MNMHVSKTSWLMLSGAVLALAGVSCGSDDAATPQGQAAVPAPSTGAAGAAAIPTPAPVAPPAAAPAAPPAPAPAATPAPMPAAPAPKPAPAAPPAPAPTKPPAMTPAPMMPPAMMPPATPAVPQFTFFVTSDTSMTGNLGGLAGADARCQKLAVAAGQTTQMWQAYLSADAVGAQPVVNARDRIGTGPFINSKGVMLAATVDELHALDGSRAAFLDEKGVEIAQAEHDILTGSDQQGRLMAATTCENWTSASEDIAAQVGHTDNVLNLSWPSAHANESCANTVPRGGAGRLYCFAAGPAVAAQ